MDIIYIYIQLDIYIYIYIYIYYTLYNGISLNITTKNLIMSNHSVMAAYSSSFNSICAGSSYISKCCLRMSMFCWQSL